MDWVEWGAIHIPRPSPDIRDPETRAVNRVLHTPTPRPALGNADLEEYFAGYIGPGKVMAVASKNRQRSPRNVALISNRTTCIYLCPART
jgi:hypothetical protein